MYTILSLYITAIAFILIFIYIFKKYKKNSKDAFLRDLCIILISISTIEITKALGFTFMKYYSIFYASSLVPEALIFGYLMKFSIDIYHTERSYNIMFYITILLYLFEIFLIPFNPLKPKFYPSINTYTYGLHGFLAIYDTSITAIIVLIILFNFFRFSIKIWNDKFNRYKFLFSGFGILITVVSLTIHEIIRNMFTNILESVGYIVGLMIAIIFISKQQK